MNERMNERTNKRNELKNRNKTGSPVEMFSALNIFLCNSHSGGVVVIEREEEHIPPMVCYFNFGSN